ncbi:mucin-associated surface protein (MASP), putative, partial [Trypanosoma cruzi marinkellei]
MMMTGRVLLVCALCVLWCGAVFGHAMDDYCGGGGGNVLRHTSNGGSDGVSLKTDGRLLSTRMGLIKAVEASEGELSVDDTNPLDKGNSLDESKGEGVGGLGGVVAGPPAAAAAPSLPLLDTKASGLEDQSMQPEVVDANVVSEADDKKDNKEGEAAQSQHQSVDQSSSSTGGSGTVGVKELSSKTTPKSNESPDIPPKEEQHRLSKSRSGEKAVEEETVLSEQEAGDKNDKELTKSPENTAKHTEIPTTSQVKGQS